MKVYMRRYGAIFLLSFTSCRLSDVTDIAQTLEGTNINHEVIESAEGARWVYWGAIAKFARLFSQQAASVAYFTDELALMNDRSQKSIDARVQLGSPSAGAYITMENLANEAQSTRIQLSQAIQLLNKYYEGEGNAMKAHAYGLLGVVHLMLADNFCSGFPLSESNWGGEFIPTGGVPTDDVYRHAINYADKGLALENDSLEVKVLLLGVKARALNSLGRYEEAAAIANKIASTDSVWEIFGPQPPDSSAVSYIPVNNIDTGSYFVLNNKGQNGLMWVADSVSNQDGRIAVVTTPDGSNFLYPLKPDFFFNNRKIAYFSGAEARLIEAEYYLQIGEISSFLEKINHVRRMFATISGRQLTDTVDPGTSASRLDLLFRERAYTFYITGRRLADMRRLVRKYGRDPLDVWPTGRSEGSQFILYGDNYVFTPEIPGIGRESTYNHLYYECASYEP